jgi:hypothetical protein
VRWNAFPPVSANSPYEVVRFLCHEEGHHVLIVFRQPHSPGSTLEELSGRVQQVLEGRGFGNFSTAETTLRSRRALTLSFDKPMGAGTWSCRHYFVAEGTLGYALGFGTSSRQVMFELYDRMARSFEILETPPTAEAGA